MKRIQSLIPTAVTSASNNLVNEDGSIDSETNGYISSFGASVISAGLLPSIIFYSQQGESKDRHRIITCLEDILKQHGFPNLNLIDKVSELYTDRRNDAEISRLTEKIFDAAIALKLAIRTFPRKSKKD